MIREERMINEAKRYYSGNIKCYDAFLHGAQWADNNPDLSLMWHDADDEPEDGSDVLLLDSEQRVTSTRYHVSYYDVCGLLGWPAYVANYDVKRWAYISDLLPRDTFSNEKSK